MAAKTTFTLEYALSIIITLFVLGILRAKNQNVNIVIQLLAGLIISYLTLFILNTIFPKINNIGLAIQDTTIGITQSTIYNTGFAEIYPPLLAVFIIFLICLYSGKI